MTAAGVYLIFPEPIVRQLAATLSRTSQLTPGQGIMAPATTTATTAGVYFCRDSDDMRFEDGIRIFSLSFSSHREGLKFEGVGSV